MADAWGVDDGYWDVDGQWHDTPETTRGMLRSAMGAADVGHDGPPGGPPVWFVRHGRTPAVDRPAILALEDGTELAAEDALPPDLPLGYHDLLPSDGGATTRLIVVPDRAAAAPDRGTALAVQVYAARSAASWGIGDLGDVATLARWAAAGGIDALLLSPLHAPLPVASPEPSPYFASSRRFRNPLHLRIEAVPGWDGDDIELAELAVMARGLDADRRIDRTAVWAQKRAALAHIWARAAGRSPDPAFHSWRALGGEDLQRYATFCAIAEQRGAGWLEWPEELRRPDAAGVARYAGEHPDEVAFHAWLQWLADLQHAAAAAAGPALVHDLAVGAAPDGADAWLWQDVLAPGVHIGAPPDAFNAAGQDWGLPPFVPWRLRAAGYEPLARLFASSFRHAAGLRVDHVMGLFRLWWVPEGHGASEGGYVHYPGTELLDVLALESARAGAFVVGEDLGTVEDAVRTALAERGVLSYRVAWFEDAPPSAWPRQSLAALSTHDLPTLAGVWSGADDPDGSMQPRLHELTGATDGTLSAVAVAAHRALASAPAQVVSATLEDLLGVADRPNVPGTTTEHPNWSTALPVGVDDLDDAPMARAVLGALVSGD